MHPLRIRTITAFSVLGDSHAWDQQITAVGGFLAKAQTHFESSGYEVQTLRLATQPFSDFPEACRSNLVAHVVDLERLCKAAGIPLISIGSSSRPEDLQTIPSIISATSSVSCSFALPEGAPLHLVQAAAAAVLEVSKATGGHGNFRFAVSANCQPGIPYFPVACASPQLHGTFALGTECDGLLHTAFTSAASKAAAAAAAVGATPGAHTGALQQQQQQPGECILAQAQQQLASILLDHFQPLEVAALQLEAMAAGQPAATLPTSNPSATNNSIEPAGGDPLFQGRYAGLDTSIAPGLDTPAMTSAYEALGRGQFGGPGTLAISSLITAVLKQLPVRRTGYCGLMLAVCEDAGLAAAAAEGRLCIPQLLQWSAVCGCGLDTVPVPGPALSPSSDGSCRQQEQEHDQKLALEVAGVLLDTAALAYRLGKPLACRLLPLPGKTAGDPTAFTNPYLIDSRVLSLSN